MGLVKVTKIFLFLLLYQKLIPIQRSSKDHERATSKLAVTDKEEYAWLICYGPEFWSRFSGLYLPTKQLRTLKCRWRIIN